MDGIHDLGGKQGFGPINVTEPTEPFHEEWEARVWGISCSTGAPGITIDWWRYIREMTIPEDYLTRPYLDSWSESDMVTLVDSNICTVEELATGKSNTPRLEDANNITVDQALEANRMSSRRFDRPSNADPKYIVGNDVVTCQFTSTGHTRLPAYVRGKPGKVYAYHGAHLLPDAGAKGEEIAEHLYTIAFNACDLWPEAHDSNDIIFVDLWESYFDN
ncbi:nitrile hydratase subunit beta [Kiloniella spongiae]|uniref:nitrile hydratase subunit beta n=1 Tax=Kiloniella spongiae TaxID=1489064 RepID=UPI000699DC49|nr:nitrile hydratase subunit beta [Kiloniella spongiae]